MNGAQAENYKVPALTSAIVEDQEGMRGGSEGDIRSLYFWTRSAYYMLIISGALWAAYGLSRLWRGMTWWERDALVGSTRATFDITSGIAMLLAAVVTIMLARWVKLDVLQVFEQRRFQVPREKLLVWAILGLPLGFVVSGVMLLLVNWKLSFPEFLPSHADAYPDAMPGFVQVPAAALATGEPSAVYEGPVVPEDAPRELAPLGFDLVPVTEEEAQPAPEFFGEAPVPAGPYEPLPPETPPTPTTPPVAPVMAQVEELPEEEIPEVVAEIMEEARVPPSASPAEEPVPAVYEEMEEVPAPARVAAVVEEAPEEDAGADFELIEEPPPEEPRTIESAHEELLGKLLKKK